MIRPIKGGSNVTNCFLCDGRPIIMFEGKMSARYDTCPVTSGHILMAPKRHIKDLFGLELNEWTDLFILIGRIKNMLMAGDSSIEGFNIGINEGDVAGQTIDHLHIHLIPRRKGDCENPRGGVRGVIPEKQSY